MTHRNTWIFIIGVAMLATALIIFAFASATVRAQQSEIIESVRCLAAMQDIPNPEPCPNPDADPELWVDCVTGVIVERAYLVQLLVLHGDMVRARNQSLIVSVFSTALFLKTSEWAGEL